MSEPIQDDLTPTQRAILNVLSDGEPHSREELRSCLRDELAEPSTLRRHIADIRESLAWKGVDITCERLRATTWYRLVAVADYPWPAAVPESERQ